MLSCQLSDPSEVTDYEWVHVSYDINGTESVGPVQEGQTIPVKEDFGEWTCRYLGENGLLGNVTTQVHLMGKTHNKYELHMEAGFISTGKSHSLFSFFFFSWSEWRKIVRSLQ